MAEFMLLFRNDKNGLQEPSDPMPEIGQLWWAWMQKLQSVNKLVSTGNRLSRAGRVIRTNDMVIDGPYSEVKEYLAGYMTILADDFSEAISIANECPILVMGGCVEIRQFIAPDDNVS